MFFRVYCLETDKARQLFFLKYADDSKKREAPYVKFPFSISVWGSLINCPWGLDYSKRVIGIRDFIIDSFKQKIKRSIYRNVKCKSS